MCQDNPVSFTVGLGLDPNEGSTMGSDFGEVQYNVRCDEAFDPGQYPRELDATEHLQCDMVGVEPGSGEAVAAQRWGTDEVARFTSASEACYLWNPHRDRTVRPTGSSSPGHASEHNPGHPHRTVFFVAQPKLCFFTELVVL